MVLLSSSRRTSVACRPAQRRRPVVERGERGQRGHHADLLAEVDAAAWAALASCSCSDVVPHLVESLTDQLDLDLRLRCWTRRKNETWSTIAPSVQSSAGG